MSMRPGRPSSIDGIKRFAKLIKAEKGFQHTSALNEAATLAGYQNFAHAKRALASKGKPAPGRQISTPPSQERPKTMTNDDFLANARETWVRSIDAAAGPGDSHSVTWRGPAEISRALSHVMGSGRNHAHLPGGGGMDITAVEPSSERGCLDLRVGRRTIYRVKPDRLVLERIQSRPVESFLLLELEELGPSGAYPEDESAERAARPFPTEEYVEGGDGELYERSTWDGGVTPDGDPLPDGSRLVVRFMRGKVLFVSKGSIWNGWSATYDGRHSNMSAADIRSIIERIVARS